MALLLRHRSGSEQDKHLPPLATALLTALAQPGRDPVTLSPALIGLGHALLMLPSLRTLLAPLSVLLAPLSSGPDAALIATLLRLL